MEGASKVLYEQGFHGVSIRDIAAACGMSMGQLYHYISSKDDILFLMHVYSQEMWHQHLADAGFDQIADPVAKLEHGLRITMKYLSENRDLYQFLYTESKYLDREHLREVLDLDDQNVVGFYRHLLSEIPGAPAAIRATWRPTSWPSSACSSPCAAGTCTCRARPTWTPPSTISSTSSSAVSASTARRPGGEGPA